MSVKKTKPAKKPGLWSREETVVDDESSCYFAGSIDTMDEKAHLGVRNCLDLNVKANILVDTE